MMQFEGPEPQPYRYVSRESRLSWAYWHWVQVEPESYDYCEKCNAPVGARLCRTCWEEEMRRNPVNAEKLDILQQQEDEYTIQALFDGVLIAEEEKSQTVDAVEVVPHVKEGRLWR